MGQKGIFTVFLSVLYTVTTSSLMLFEGQAGEALERSGILSYPLLTPWCKVLLEQLAGLQLVKKFPAFHGIRRFITALTSEAQTALFKAPVRIAL